MLKKRSKLFSLAIPLFVMTSIGCQSRPTKIGAQTPPPGTSSSTTGGDQGTPGATNETAPSNPPVEIHDQERPTANSKVVVIFGPGGLRTFAHAGVIQELIRAKIPISAIGGLEWGSLAAALSARKGQPFDAEWQMLKLKEDEVIEKSLLGDARPKDASKAEVFLQKLFDNDKAESSSLSFACPSYNLEKRGAFIMHKGLYRNLLPYCLAFPPLLTPYKGSIGDLTQLSGLIQHFRSQGPATIIYVNVLSQIGGLIKDSRSPEAIQWVLVQQSLEQQMAQADFVINVDIDTAIGDFQSRRQAMDAGRNSVKKNLPDLLRKFSTSNSPK